MKVSAELAYMSAGLIELGFEVDDQVSNVSTDIIHSRDATDKSEMPKLVSN